VPNLKKIKSQVFILNMQYGMKFEDLTLIYPWRRLAETGVYQVPLMEASVSKRWIIAEETCVKLIN
jgi:hypothetical protein